MATTNVNEERQVLPIDIIYLVAERCDTPAEVLNLAKLNWETWSTLKPMVYRKEVTYTRASGRLPYNKPRELFKLVLDAFGGPSLADAAKLRECGGFTQASAADGSPEPAHEWHGEHLLLQERFEKENKHGLALHRAINDGKDVKLIKRLISSAQLHNKRGYLDGLDFPILPSPLHNAAALGQVPTIRLLLAAGCTVNNFFGDFNHSKLKADGGVYDFPEYYHEWEVPSIVGSLSTLHLDPTQEMVDANNGASKYQRYNNLDSNPTPADYAARFGKTEAVRLLLDAHIPGIFDERLSLLAPAAHESPWAFSRSTYPGYRAGYGIGLKTIRGVISHPTVATSQSLAVQRMRIRWEGLITRFEIGDQEWALKGAAALLDMWEWQETMYEGAFSFLDMSERLTREDSASERLPVEGATVGTEVNGGEFICYLHG